MIRGFESLSPLFFLFLGEIIAADFNIRMINVKVRQHRQGYPLTKINVRSYISGSDQEVALW